MGGRAGAIRIATAKGFGDTSYRALLQGALDLLDARIAELRAVGNADRDPAVRRAARPAAAVAVAGDLVSSPSSTRATLRASFTLRRSTEFFRDKTLATIEARLAELAAETAPARTALAAENVDAEIATRLESRLNRTCAELDEALWQVRLEALFSQI